MSLEDKDQQHSTRAEPAGTPAAGHEPSAACPICELTDEQLAAQIAEHTRRMRSMNGDQQARPTLKAFLLEKERRQIAVLTDAQLSAAIERYQSKASSGDEKATGVLDRLIAERARREHSAEASIEGGQEPRQHQQMGAHTITTTPRVRRWGSGVRRCCVVVAALLGVTAVVLFYTLFLTTTLFATKVTPFKIVTAYTTQEVQRVELSTVYSPQGEGNTLLVVEASVRIEDLVLEKQELLDRSTFDPWVLASGVPAIRVLLEERVDPETTEMLSTRRLHAVENLVSFEDGARALASPFRPTLFSSKVPIDASDDSLLAYVIECQADHYRWLTTGKGVVVFPDYILAIDKKGNAFPCKAVLESGTARHERRSGIGYAFYIDRMATIIPLTLEGFVGIDDKAGEVFAGANYRMISSREQSTPTMSSLFRRMPSFGVLSFEIDILLTATWM